jgi:2-dehydro-3-deoxygluconokinase
MKTLVTFGEIMARLAPEGVLRFQQAMPGRLNVTFAGAEANVAVSYSYLGGVSRFVTALPSNPLADSCLRTLQSFGVDTTHIVQTGEGRLGLYFVETGANQRPGRVIYDRDGSSVAIAPRDVYDWHEILEDAGWAHVSGITPAVSRQAADATLDLVRIAGEQGIPVSCDLNFRKKLWRWEEGTGARELAERTMREILPYVGLVIANEEDASDVLSIRAVDSDVEQGRLSIDRYPAVAREIVKQFPNVGRVAVTLRESVSASHNNWGAMLYTRANDQAVFAPQADGAYRPYEIRNIVDRVGGGDSFAAALLFALTNPELDAADHAIAFASAASCLAHSITGDFNFNTREEVESLMRGSGSGRVVR